MPSPRSPVPSEVRAGERGSAPVDFALTSILVVVVVLALLVAALCVAFQAVFFWYSLLLTLRATELTTVFQIPKSLLYSCMPAASLVMLAYSVCDIVVEGRSVFAPPAP